MPRRTRQVETRLVSEYLKEHYSKFPFINKCPVGRVDESLMAELGYEKALNITTPSRYEIDAVVILPRYLLIIEAKVWQVVNGLAKLPLYKSLVPVTPELRQYKDKEILMQCVVGWSNANLETMAQSMGVALVVYCPDWLKEVVQGMHKYWTKEYQAERTRKLQMREYFGVE